MNMIWIMFLGVVVGVIIGMVVLVAFSLIQIRRRNRRAMSDFDGASLLDDPEARELSLNFLRRKRFRMEGAKVARRFMIDKIRSEMNSSNDELDLVSLEILFLLFLDFLDFSELREHMNSRFGYCPNQSDFMCEVSSELSRDTAQEDIPEIDMIGKNHVDFEIIQMEKKNQVGSEAVFDVACHTECARDGLLPFVRGIYSSSASPDGNTAMPPLRRTKNVVEDTGGKDEALRGGLNDSPLDTRPGVKVFRSLAELSFGRDDGEDIKLGRRRRGEEKND